MRRKKNCLLESNTRSKQKQGKASARERELAMYVVVEVNKTTISMPLL